MIGPLALLARRSLFRNRVRLAASVGGVSLALALALTLNAVVAGMSGQLTSYIDHAGADVWVAQQGVHNLHMTASWLPATVTDQVRNVPGVAEASPIMYSTGTISAGSARKVAYVLGLPTDAKLGLPVAVRQGVAVPGSGEAVIGEDFAGDAHVRLGDQVTILGRSLRVVGIAQSQANLVNSVAFVSMADFAAARGGSPVVSFVLVRTSPGVSADTVAANIARSVPGVGAYSSSSFADEERRLIMAMAGDVITTMNLIGFAVALAVLALTVYLATLAGRREYGVLKALGAGTRFLYGVVLTQAAISIALGLVAALALTLALSVVVPAVGVPLGLTLEAGSVAQAVAVSAVIAAISCVLPVRQIARIDPAVVFRRGAV